MESKGKAQKNNYTMGVVPSRPYRINQMLHAGELHEVMKREKGIDLPVAKDVSVLQRPLRVGNKTIPNSLAVHPCEGFDGTKTGDPSESVFRRYKRYAAGGSGLIWFETFAPADDGKDGPNQLTLKKHNIPSVTRLLKETDDAAANRFGADSRPYKVAQISHSGMRSVDDNWNPTPIVGAHNPFFDCTQRGEIVIASDAYIEELVGKYVNTAVNAMEAGFDGVDMKICHSYILGNLMSAFIRPGKYGGCFENRIRAILEIVDGINKKCGNNIDICVRMNAYDAIPYPHGWGMVQEPGVMAPDLSEPIRLLRILADKGVKIANITTCASRYQPYGDGLFARTRGIEPDPYLGVYHLLKATRDLRAAVPELLYIGTGLSWFEKLCGHVGAGCIEQGWIDIAGYGRQALAYPEYARDLLVEGRLEPRKTCLLCDKCHELSMRGRTKVGCVARDPEHYLALYRENVQADT